MVGEHVEPSYEKKILMSKGRDRALTNKIQVASHKMRALESAWVGSDLKQSPFISIEREKNIEREEGIIRWNHLVIELIMLEREKNKNETSRRVKTVRAKDWGVFPT